MLYDPATNPDEPWRRELLQAAEVLKINGWTRGSFKNEEGQQCLLGAVATVVGIDLSDLGAWQNVYVDPRVVSLAQHLGFSEVAYALQFNDEKSRSVEDVIALLEDRARAMVPA